jgi:hypothetical protein
MAVEGDGSMNTIAEMTPTQRRWAETTCTVCGRRPIVCKVKDFIETYDDWGNWTESVEHSRHRFCKEHMRDSISFDSAGRVVTQREPEYDPKTKTWTIPSPRIP